ncbi:MAG: signal peptidase I [Planctomycetota bacterium]|nr:signal peptidase I [Planctomycetota bacterium]
MSSEKTPGTSTGKPSSKPTSTSSIVAPTWSHTFRETVESVVIAFILAFLFRTFEAEAFVIPTGSMAPVLQGMHKDMECSQCKYPYRVGVKVPNVPDANGNFPSFETQCPQCGYREDASDVKKDPDFSGDRILVSKFAYDFAEPNRFDVVVFKYPEDPKTNYIKRLVGLPGETIKIQDGDIYFKGIGDTDFQIARKPNAGTLLAMLHDVYNNDYALQEFMQAGWPSRWRNFEAGRAIPSGSATASWTPDADSKVFTNDGSSGGESWLRYQHLFARQAVWNDFEAKLNIAPDASPELIRDTYAYNGSHGNLLRDDAHWVGDLVLDFQAKVESTSGQLVVELIKGGRKFQARFDLATGEVRLEIPGFDTFHPQATTAVVGPGTYQLRFANVDEELWLWVDDELIKFEGGTRYPPLGNNKEVTNSTLPGDGSDLSPVGIATNGAKVEVSHLNIRRDIFYIAQWTQQQATASPDNGSDTTDSETNGGEPHSITLKKFDDQPELDQFFMLGDNSPQSKDGRLWGRIKKDGRFSGVQYVERRLLIGKALYIFWPHSWPASWAVTWRFKGMEVEVPFWPNFKRMGLIR